MKPFVGANVQYFRKLNVVAVPAIITKSYKDDIWVDLFIMDGGTQRASFETCVEKGPLSAGRYWDWIPMPAKKTEPTSDEWAYMGYTNGVV